MMKYRNCVIALFLVLLSVSACKSNDDVVVERSDYEQCNAWILQAMRSDYLWKSSIPEDSKLNTAVTPQTFFYTLLSDNDGKHTSSKDYYYSYIEENKDYASSRTIDDDTDSYGMSFIRYTLYRNNVATGYEYDRVAYVLPGSAAETAGLKRGDWIAKIDGSDINMNTADYKKLLNGTVRSLTVYHTMSDKTGVTISLPASSAVVNDPVFLSKVFEVNGKKIGYLVYNEFAMGPHASTTDHTYDTELIALFNSTFKDVDEFVLDLRYNPGGYLSCAQLLSRLLVPSVSVSNLFARLKDADGNTTDYKFSDVDHSNSYDLNDFKSLNLSRLFVIATGSTASAAEATMNGLAPYLNVVHIGLTTEGKNMGSVNYKNNSYAWDFQPITFSITSAAGNDYSSGLAPEYQLNELNNTDNPAFLNLGDADEYLLSKALNLISGSVPGSKMNLQKKEEINTSLYQLVPKEMVSSSSVKGLIKTTD
jgi:C-terminal processing protease CtpA/Prc